MNQDLIIRDVRLKGPRPKGTEVLEVDSKTPITWPIAWILGKAKAYHSSFVRLRIMAHGFETKTSSGTVVLGREFGAKYSQGGGGICFCKENITIGNLGVFSPLRDWLDWVDLLNCGTAYITPGFEGTFGDGNILCSRLAQIIQAPVRASTATQTYSWSSGAIDFGAWEGTVLTYGPHGNVINVESAPAH